MTNKDIYNAIVGADVLLGSLIAWLCSACGNCDKPSAECDCGGGDAIKALKHLQKAECEMLRRIKGARE